MLESKTIFEKVLEDKEQVLRLHHNRLLESAQVGDKPFDKEFYETAPMPHRIMRNMEILLGQKLYIYIVREFIPYTEAVSHQTK